MEQRTVGRSGLKVSVVGLGCNNFGARVDVETAQATVHQALDAGITLFDTADSYGERGGSEAALGKILGPRRKDIVLASKFGMPMDDGETRQGASRRYIMSAVEASLKRLNTDWIDLYQLHRPDPSTPIEETMRALDDLVRQGKVRYIGCSNLPAWQVVDAIWHARSGGLEPFVSAQDEYSLLNREAERELIPALRAQGVGLLPYYPLASGVLTGKYSGGRWPERSRLTLFKRMADRHLTPTNLAIANRLHEFCRWRGRSMLELAFSWLVQRDCVVSVIAGASGPTQVDENVAAANWRVSDQDLDEIDQITTQPSPA